MFSGKLATRSLVMLSHVIIIVVCDLTKVLLHFLQGLIVEADAVSTPYAFAACDLYLFLPDRDFRVCLEWGQLEVESAPVTPPFVYNNQCASVLLTSYLPVLILGFSIQILVSVLLPVILNRVGEWLGLVDIIHGILWPEFWLRSEESESHVIKLERNPSIMLNSKVILCFDILNNVMILLSFGCARLSWQLR